MKNKILLIIIVFLLMPLITATFCSKNKANENEKKIAPVSPEQKERVDEVQLEKIVNYGFARAMMYRDCLISLNKIGSINGQYTFEVLQLKDSVEEFDDIIFLKCKKIKGLNFMIRTKREKYYYGACVSDDDIGVIVLNASSAVRSDELTVRISSLTKDKIQTFVNASDKVKVIENIKRQIKIIFEDSDLKANQNFYIGPFSEFDLGIRIYWVEKKCFIDLSRTLFDMELKNIAVPQLVIRDWSDKEQVDAIIKYGTLITIAKASE